MFYLQNRKSLIKHEDIEDIELRKMIRNGSIQFGGNRKLKIYGKLDCKSGKRMKIINRVFFNTEEDAIQLGYRPCGNCMRTAYKKWKSKSKI